MNSLERATAIVANVIVAASVVYWILQIVGVVKMLELAYG